ncbi:MAG: hypothetical protein LBI59_07070, partial [Candidatus Accumulibacter sp.]|nr:hypothetical protein [Accumulibacter sp.]
PKSWPDYRIDSLREQFAEVSRLDERITAIDIAATLKRENPRPMTSMPGTSEKSGGHLIIKTAQSSLTLLSPFSVLISSIFRNDSVSPKSAS